MERFYGRAIIDPFPQANETIIAQIWIGYIVTEYDSHFKDDANYEARFDWWMMFRRTYMENAVLEKKKWEIKL